MYLYETRRHNKRVRRFSGLFIDNPVFSLGLALPFVVAAANSAQSAVCLMIGMAVSLFPAAVFSVLPGRRLPAWLSIPGSALCAAALLVPVDQWLSAIYPLVMDSIGVYFPILAVNTLMIHLCLKRTGDGGRPRALCVALLQMIGFAVATLLVGILREVLGNGTIWEIPLSFMVFKMHGLLIPFGGCMVAAFLSAGAKFMSRGIRIGLYHRDTHRLMEERREARRRAGLPEIEEGRS